MGVVLTALAVWLLVGEPGGVRRLRGHLTHRNLTDRYGTSHEYDVPVRRGIAYSTVVGFVSSFLGIGGGVIHVPLLVRALGFPTHLATATSHFVLAIIAASGAATHVISGSFAHGDGVRRALAFRSALCSGLRLAHDSLYEQVAARSSRCSQSRCSYSPFVSSSATSPDSSFPRAPIARLRIAARPP